jgi:glycosyltransferase involved in cell wall biosynthesis
MTTSRPSVTAVVCTRNSIASIEACLRSLRANRVDQLVVVDASSTDGTRSVAERLADQVITDAGEGLGAARNLGIAVTTGDLILNCGADNVFPDGALERMVQAKQAGAYDGVGAVTRVVGRGYLSWAMGVYRTARFAPGEREVIGTPSLFDGAGLRRDPFDPRARYSDDAELCERWSRSFGARFAITDVVIDEIGQTSWHALLARYRTYGVSDSETFRRHVHDWPLRRRVQSLTHPLRVDLVEPFQRAPFPTNLAITPFLFCVTSVRYLAWIANALAPDTRA